jgi:hypothetical protein
MKLTEATKFHRKSGGGPAAKREPSPEGLGINPEDDLSAIGAALNLDFSQNCLALPVTNASLYR